MTTEEKKLLTDILVGISSIDDHLEGRRILEMISRIKPKEELWKGNLKSLVKP
jgi:hypothetical protein